MKNFTNSSLPSLRVQIGDICCSLLCSDQEVLKNLQQQYSNFLSDKPADISIELHLIEKLSTAEINAALPQMRIRAKGNQFKATNLTFKGKYDFDKHLFNLKLEKNFFAPDVGLKLMNRLFCLAYLTACKAKYSEGPPAMLVHSCGILRRGKVLVFAGPCETGKTTIGRLCGDEYGRVLNDETLLFHRPGRNNGTLTVQGVPIIGGIPQRLNEAAPLSCVLMLKQSKRNALRRLTPVEAYRRFMLQVISPAHFGQRDERARLSLIADFSSEVTAVTPVYELEFSLDKDSLWKVLGELELSLEKEK